MRFKRAILAQPRYARSIFTMPVPPVGLGYIAQVLKKNNIDYRVMDFMLGHDFADLKKQIYEFFHEIIGFTMMSFMYKNTYNVLRRIRQEFPDIKIIVGGPHISSCKEQALLECEAIDFGVVQEGEETMEELCLGEDTPEVKNLLYRENGKIKFTGFRDSAMDLNLIPFPQYANFELKKYGFGISIVSSRGCPYKCIFCLAQAIRRNYRTRNPKNVVDEMQYWYDRGYREFDLQEDNPTFDKRRVFELCDEIERRNFKDIIIMCGNGVRADRVDRELLKRMREVGFKRLAFGVEGGNNKVLEALKKGEKIEVIKQAIKDACDLGFFVSIFFVVGSPTETPKDVQDSIDIALSYPISHVNFYNLIPLPGTELYDWVKKNNYFLIKPEIYMNDGGRIQMGSEPVFETPEFPTAQRRLALKRTKRVERLVKKKVIAVRLNRIYPMNKVISWVYTLNAIKYIEDRLISYELFRRTLGKLRSKIRLIFYKI